MKINGLDDEIVVDDIPSTFDPNRKIFLTTLVNVNVRTLPRAFSTIYTSKPLKLQLKQLLKGESIEIENKSFHILKPFEPEVITLSNGNTYEVLPCCPEGISPNMLLLFRKGPIITHVYVGLCSDFQSILTHKTFVSWLKKYSVDDMYMSTIYTEKCVDCELRNAIDEIESLLNANNSSKVLIQLPLFGSESFIAKVASEFSGYVTLDSILRTLYCILPAAVISHFSSDFDSARIIIISGDKNDVSGEIERRYGTKFKVADTVTNCLPLPSTYDIDLIVQIIRPKNIHKITVNMPQKIVISSGCCEPSVVPPNQIGTKFIRKKSVGRGECCFKNFKRFHEKVITCHKSFVEKQLGTSSTPEFARLVDEMEMYLQENDDSSSNKSPKEEVQ